MTISYNELPRQTGELHYKRPTGKREYVVSGTSNRTEALLTIANASPPFESSIDSLGNPILIFRNKISIEEKGGGVWNVTVIYEASPDTVELSVSIGVKSAKILQALDTVRTYDAISGGSSPGAGDWGDVPAFANAIGVNGDEVAGTDVELGTFEITITKKWKLAVLAGTYFSTLASFTRPYTAVNHATYAIIWKGQTLTFPKGSLRFRGSSVKWNADDEVEITYQLSYDGGITTDDDFTIGDSDVITKEGWEYLWVNYKKALSNNVMVNTPFVVVINQVYPYKDFNLLNL